MNGEQRRGNLFAIHGQATESGRPAGRLVAIAPPPRCKPQQLLLFSTPIRRQTLISLGMDGLPFTTFQRVLEIYSVKCIIDIRLLAAFRSRGFEPTAVCDLFMQGKIDYKRASELGNPFVGEYLDERILFEKFLAHLENQKDAMHNLKQTVEEGPVVLLGRSAAHQGSERDAVVRVLANVMTGFDLIIINPSNFTDLDNSCQGSLLVGGPSLLLAPNPAWPR